MNLNFLSRDSTETLSRSIKVNLSFYENGETTGLVKDSDCRLSKIESVDAPLLLDENGGPLSDIMATKAIYQWLSHLTPVQAADERLWTYLTHHTYAQYVHKRWSRLSEAEKQEEFIKRRWFFRGEGVATFVQNGISRLWWFGYLTFDEKRGNPFELTDVLLSLQDIQVAFLERSLGRSGLLLRVVLETIIKFKDILESTPKRGEVIQEWAKDIRLYGGAYVIDVVPEKRLAFVFEKFLKNRIS